jgi:hypothetical protein
MNETLNFKVGENTYTINFPTVGEYYAIQASKQSLSVGYYNSLSESMVKSANNAADMIDIEATLTILCPSLLKDLKRESFKKLGLKDYLIVKKAYVEQFVPWSKEIEELLNPSKKD